jgi:hypothetical protein
VSHEQLHERSYPERVEHRTHTESSAEQPAGEYHCQFDSRACEANRPSGARNQPGHQTVSGARAHSRTDVERRGEGIDDDARHHCQCPNDQPVQMGQDRRRRIHGDSDDDHVAHGPQTRTLPQRYPHQEHRHAGDGSDGSEAQRQVPRQTLVEHIPGVDSESTGDHQRHGRAVQPQADVERRQARRETTAGDAWR